MINFLVGTIVAVVAVSGTWLAINADINSKEPIGQQESNVIVEAGLSDNQIAMIEEECAKDSGINTANLFEYIVINRYETNYNEFAHCTNDKGNTVYMVKKGSTDWVKFWDNPGAPDEETIKAYIGEGLPETWY